MEAGYNNNTGGLVFYTLGGTNELVLGDFAGHSFGGEIQKSKGELDTQNGANTHSSTLSPRHTQVLMLAWRHRHPTPPHHWVCFGPGVVSPLSQKPGTSLASTQTVLTHFCGIFV